MYSEELRDSSFKGFKAQKPVQNQISTIHFLLSDSLNNYEEHLKGSWSTLKILRFQGHF